MIILFIPQIFEHQEDGVRGTGVALALQNQNKTNGK